MVSLTESAAKEVKRIITENSLPGDTGVRIGIKGGGCAGFTYVFDFDSEPGKFDVTFKSQDLRVIVDRKSLLYIDGTIIDFKTSLSERGFSFDNPRANAACGCGTSFMPKETMLS